MVKLPVLQTSPAKDISQIQTKPSREPLIRGVFVAIYLFVVLLGLCESPLQATLVRLGWADTPVGSSLFRATRIFWTIGLPFAPLFMVVFGYYLWRRLCPIAVFTRLGGLIPRAKQRRLPPWFERWGYMVIFSTMFVSLGARLLFTNGSGVFLGVWLLLILLAAFVVGAIFTGKTWCNFICPISLIEKVYTEPTGMGPGAKASNSQCKKCTACKRHCPDIDVEMGYWKEKDILSRRMATYGWPGLVFAFYAAYWAYKGNWDYYFSGQWTREPTEWRNVWGPGFFFAPWVPKIAAMYIALLVPTLVSWALFFGLERLLQRRYGEERGTHFTLSLAAFTAFNLFYLFAGQPTWRKLFVAGAQVGPYLISFLSIVISAWFFLRRMPRREDEAVQERFAKRFVARWQWKDEKPPEDLREAFYVIKRKEQEKEVGLKVYFDTIRELMSEGVLTRAKLRIIEQVRTQFNISDADHEKVLSQLELSDRELMDEKVVVSAEERLREDSYRIALQSLLLRGAPKRDIDNLRSEYGITPEMHQRLLDELSGKGGGYRHSVEDLLARIEDLRAVFQTLCGFVVGPSLEFLSLVLLKRQDRLVDHTLDMLSLMGMGDLIRQNRGRLFDQDKVSRASAIEALVHAGEPDLMERLVPILEERVPAYDPRIPVTTEQEDRVLDALASEHDAFVRAGAMLASATPGEPPRPSSIERLLAGMNDEDALVREAAIQVLPTGSGMAAGAQIRDTSRDTAGSQQKRGPGGAQGMPPRGPMPPNLSGGPMPPNLSGGPMPPNFSGGPMPPNLSGGPMPPNLSGGPMPPNLSGGPMPPSFAAPPPPVQQASISNDDKLPIGDGFAGIQADTLVTGRFAVPRLPTNLGPVCTNLERILFLHCVPLFVDFEPDDLLVLARASEERGYPESTVLFKQGDIGDEVFVIISGRVQLVYSELGDERTATTLGPGDCIGEMSVIDGSLRSNTAVVTGVNTRVLAIAGDTFRRFVKDHPHISGKIIGVLANRLRQLSDRAERQARKLHVPSSDAVPLSLPA